MIFYPLEINILNSMYWHKYINKMIALTGRQRNLDV